MFVEIGVVTNIVLSENLGVNPLRVNEETGFLESPTTNHSIALERGAFTSARKVRVLQLINEAIDKEEYPSLDKICKEVGIAVRTFTEHVQIDEAFRRAWWEVKDRLKSVFTEQLALKAMSKYGTVANLAMLRWLESGTWLPETKINHVTNNANENIIKVVSTVIDAELLENESENGEKS